MPSTSLYETFGNQINYDVLYSTLEIFLENSTIPFPLPQASAEILSDLGSADNTPINEALLDQIEVRLQSIGFGEPNARALAMVLIKVAVTQGVHPMEYFSLTEQTLKLTRDAYNAINGLRPVGNRIGMVAPTTNDKSRQSTLIRP